MAEPQQEVSNISIAFPKSLSIGSILSIISPGLVGRGAWGVFTARLAVMEREIVSLQQSDQEQQEALQKLYAQQQRNTAHQQEDELLIDQLFMLQRRAAPVRRAPN